MKQRIFSHNQFTQGYSVAVSSRLIRTMLNVCKYLLCEPFVTPRSRSSFIDEVSEYTDKLSPLALNKRLYNKHLLGAKITFYYED